MTMGIGTRSGVYSGIVALTVGTATAPASNGGAHSLPDGWWVAGILASALVAGISMFVTHITRQIEGIAKRVERIESILMEARE